jgi:hypothetical protein
MGGSYSSQEHGGGDYSGRFGRRLGQPLWGAGSHHLRPRHPVHVGGLGGVVPPAADPAHHYTAFHPCSNGMVERCHRQLKDALRARSAVNDRPDHLPWVLLGLRAAPKEDRDGVGRPTSAARPAADRRGAAVAIGGPNPPCPYETAAAGPGRAAGGAGGVHKRLHQARRRPAAVCAAVCGALLGPGAGRESVPAAGGRQRRIGLCGPPQTAHGGGASAGGGAAEARLAAGVGRLIHRCRLRTTELKGVLWRQRILIVV